MSKKFKILITHWIKNEKRKLYLENLLYKYNYDFLFFTEYDRLNLSEKENEILRQKISDTVNLSESCNFLNHLSCMKYIYQNLDYALIIEDDVICLSEELFSVKLEKIKNYFINNDYDIGYCGGGILGPSYFGSQERSDQYFYNISDTRFADCYFLSKKSSKIIYDDLNSKKITLPIDWAMKDTIKDQKLKVFHTFPMDFLIQGTLFGYYSSTADRNR